MKLTEKQRRFVDYYVETGNASEAARRAGYAEKAAYRTGSENLRKPQVKAAIDARLKELEEENRKLKRMFANLSLENEALKDVIAKKL